MIQLSRHRWMIVTFVNYVTLFFLSQLNHYLAPVGVSIFLSGMIISFAAMELNFRQGLLALAPIALYLDARSPLTFGFSLILFLSLFTIAHSARSRMRREIAASNIATSLLLNLLAFAAYTFAAARAFGSEAIHFGPLALNLSASVLVLIFVNRLFFDVQTGTLALFGINLAEEQREAR